jgi:hypothetical protein
MIIRTLSGPDIDNLANQSMEATLESLIEEGYLTDDQALNYAAKHVCLAVNEDSVWYRIRYWVGLAKEVGFIKPIVFKVSQRQHKIPPIII